MKTKIKVSPKSILFASLFWIVVLFIFIFYPYIYDFFVGGRVIEEHIEEVIGNETDSHKVALLLIDWHKENVNYPWIENKKFLITGAIGFYEVENKTRFFIRSESASWVIKTKLARCGESAIYFVEVMDYLGYKARTIHIEPVTWDHVWAEYYDEEGNKIIVDPSANKVILNKQNWVEGKNITKIVAKDLEGNKEDITKEYLGENY